MCLTVEDVYEGAILNVERDCPYWDKRVRFRTCKNMLGRVLISQTMQAQWKFHEEYNKNRTSTTGMRHRFDSSLELQ